MRSMLLTRPARTVVELSGVKPGEQVLVLTDTDKFSIGQVMAAVAHEAGGNVCLMVMPAQKMQGEELPPAVAAAMKAVDVVIAMVAKNIAHTTARLEATRSGTRIMLMPRVTEDRLLSPPMEADFKALRPIIQGLAKRLTEAKVARLTNAAGTDITMSLEGRRGRALDGFANTEDIAAPPGVEASIAPLEGTANGVVVVDGSIPGVGFMEGEHPKIEVRAGRLVSVTGGPLAVTFRNLLEGLNDPNVYSVAELGVGLNPMCKLRGAPDDDEGEFGSAHVAFGTNKFMGGTVVAAAHYDVVVKKATLELDGVVVLKDGQVQF
ncbi:MAG: aminopeptidase [Chloroflexota bacterium]|jgi:2,5-dihydroxypyridine 5,6-dioxygenase